VWAPWEAYAWRFAARNTRSVDRALVYAERAYVLSPLDTNMAGELADRLLRKGGQQAARVSNIAARLAGSRFPVHQILNRLLTVRFDASEARFGRALEMARDAMQPRPNDAGWVIAQRLELAWHAVEIGHVLGRASEVAGQAIAAFVEPQPPVLDWASIDTLRHVTAICAYASPEAAERCFARLERLTPSSKSPLAAGARLYAAGDPRGAAQAWQSLIRNADEQVDLLAEAMVRAFSAAGQPDVAVDIEARTRESAALFDGANMAMARAAQAAQARGNREEAVRLARRVIDAWKQADTPPPILVEMRKLVE
jgi:tetratricopeptide (TPR) repeat protein